MPITEYKVALGGSAQSIVQAVAALDGYTPIGHLAIRGGQSLQAVGEGSYDTGAVEDYQIIAGASASDLEQKVNAVLTADLQPVGGVIPRENTLLQAMGKVTASGGGAAVTWTTLTGKPPTFAPTIGLAANMALAGNTALLAIGTTASTAMAGNATPTPADNSVTNAKVAASAAIALTKLANVAAGTDGLAAGTLQATLQSLASRIQVLESAP